MPRRVVWPGFLNLVAQVGALESLQAPSTNRGLHTVTLHQAPVTHLLAQSEQPITRPAGNPISLERLVTRSFLVQSGSRSADAAKSTATLDESFVDHLGDAGQSFLRFRRSVNG